MPVPVGVIAMWSGTVATIPATWGLCDGTLGTPDLRDRFVVAALGTGDEGSSGGTVLPAAAIGPHSDHAVTQPGAHAAHVFTQPSGHAAHLFTQPGGHAAHAALGTHSHELPFIKLAGGTGALRMLAASIFGTGTSRAPESVSAAPTANTTAAAVELSQAVSGGTPDAHSAHSGGAVDAHSAHAGGAVDAHSAHSGAAVDAHSAHALQRFYKLAYIMKL